MQIILMLMGILMMKAAMDMEGEVKIPMMMEAAVTLMTKVALMNQVKVKGPTAKKLVAETSPN
jgi:hypothetical protein